VGGPSPLLFSTVRQGRQLCDTLSPTPVRLTRRALEGGTAAPSNIFYVLMQGHAVTSGRRDRSSPSLSTLCDRPRHCSSTSDTVATSRRRWDMRRQDVATTTTVPRTGPRRRHPRQPTTAASQPTSIPPPSKPLLYRHSTHHDASTGAGFARTAVSSTALLAIPPHIGKQCGMHVNCSPLAYKRRGSAPAVGRRDDGQRSLARSPPSPRDWHSLQSNLWDLEATASLPPCL
jgi:hypothetical protein